MMSRFSPLRVLALIMLSSKIASAQALPPLVIQPSAVGEGGGGLTLNQIIIANGKLITASRFGESSGLSVWNLDTLKKERQFYAGYFLHRGTLTKEEVQQLDPGYRYWHGRGETDRFIIERAVVDAKYNRFSFDQKMQEHDDKIHKASNYSNLYAHLKDGRKNFIAQAEAEKKDLEDYFFNRTPWKKEWDDKEWYFENVVRTGIQSGANSLLYYGAVYAVSPDGSYFYAYQTNRMEPKDQWQSHWIFDLKTEQKRPSAFKFRGAISSPERITTDGKYGVVRSAFGVDLCDPLSGELKKTLQYDWHIEDLAFSQDSKLIAAIGGEACVYDVETGRKLGSLFISQYGEHRKGLFKSLKGRATWGQYGEFSPSGKYLFHRGMERENRPPEEMQDRHTYVIWDWKKDKLVTSLPREMLVQFEGWGPSDDLVFIGHKDHVALIHLPTGTVVARLMQPPGSASRIYLVDHPNKLPPRTLYRPSDGLVLGQIRDVEGTTDPQGVMRLIRWDLGPHSAEILKRVAALAEKH